MIDTATAAHAVAGALRGENVWFDGVATDSRTILPASLGTRDVLATPGNLNNAIGLPLTVLRLRAHHRAAVIEIGMNHPGETAELAAIAMPNIGVINNAQREHQEFMKSVADVAAEHAALLNALLDGGVVVLNAD